MIPVIEPGYFYEGRGATAQVFLYPAGEETFSGHSMSPVGRREISDADVTRAAQWLGHVGTPDMAWTAKRAKRPSWQSGEDGYVYFISDEDGFIKIGRALKPRERLAMFQISHRQTLTLLATIPGGVAKESEMHRRFASSRHRGEWFAPSSDLLAFIAESA